MGMEKPFWTICITHMFVELYLLTQVALIPVFMREFELSLLEASLVASVPSFSQLLLNIPLGLLVDRFKPKYFLSASMLIEGSSALLLSQTNNFWILVLGASVMRISSPLYHIAGLSQIGGSGRLEKMSRLMGFHNTLGYLGSGIGVITVAVFLSTLGWRWTYLLWPIPIMTWGVITLGSSDIGGRQPDRRGVMDRGSLSSLPLVFSSIFLIFLGAIGLKEVGTTAISTYMTTYLVSVKGLPKATATLIFGLGPLMGVIGSLTGGYFGERMSAKRTLSLAILGCVFLLALLALSSEPYILTLIYLLYAILSCGTYVSMNTIAANISQPTVRGLSFSTLFFTEGLIAAITPTASALIVGSFDLWSIFPFSIAFLACSLGVLQSLPYPGRAHRSPEASQAASPGAIIY